MPQARGRLGARTTILAAAAGLSAYGENKDAPGTARRGNPGADIPHHVPDRPGSLAEYGSRDMVAQITATAIPPSMKRARPISSPKT
ncbi:hypothetical protein BCL80_105415 [Streptomyces avidinii]|nr:hypothetical protein [Streptomyces pratensis]RAS31413.1 hypothetical protein BCL80_105415 [Streptomyces avidinii]SNX77457.1 hypothetical protein SAMN05421860_104415 [Streptomyces microflavus]